MKNVEIIVVTSGHTLYNEFNNETLIVTDGNAVREGNRKLYVTENDFVKMKEKIENGQSSGDGIATICDLSI